MVRKSQRLISYPEKSVGIPDLIRNSGAETRFLINTSNPGPQEIIQEPRKINRHLKRYPEEDWDSQIIHTTRRYRIVEKQRQAEKYPGISTFGLMPLHNMVSVLYCTVQYE
jgi:hypothetical protein